MSPALSSVQFFLSAFVVFLALGSLLSAAIVRLSRKRIEQLEPRARYRVIGVAVMLPALIASTLLLSASIPALVGYFVPSLDHCLEHGDAHAHLCFVHLPNQDVHFAVLLLFVFFGAYFLARMAFGASRVFLARRLVATFRNTAAYLLEHAVSVIDVADPICFTAGLLRPQVFVSRGLLQRLSADELRVVLEHERAHVRRRDVFAASLVRLFSVAHLPSMRRWLISEFGIAVEQVCDEEAADHTKDRVTVAATILAVARAGAVSTGREFTPIAVGFGDCAVERRVRALLVEPPPQKSLRAVGLAFGILLVSAFAVADKLHHTTESALSFLAH